MRKRKLFLSACLASAIIVSAGATTISAKPSPHKVFVNGTQIDVAAYLINGNNYYKLRDVAAILNGTPSQFDVTWNAEGEYIYLAHDLPYQSVGGELTGVASAVESISQTTDPIYDNGEAVHFSGYKINGNNYYKIRDIADRFDFAVSYDAAEQAVLIESSSPEAPDIPDYNDPDPIPDPKPEPEEPSFSDKWDSYEKYKAIIDEKIREIRNEGSVYYGYEWRYEEEVDELLTEISSLQSDVNRYALDDSRQGQALLATAQEELNEKQKELSNLQESYSRKQQIESLQKMLDEYYNSLFN